ncbi:MAG: hypothetical protein R3E68_10165 [Burkholderiaceae bacterium]
MEDPSLAHALSWMTGHHGRVRSVEALFGELGLPAPLTGQHAVRVLREAGFKADVLERPLAQIHPMMLPVILLMRDGGACILTGREVAQR